MTPKEPLPRPELKNNSSCLDVPDSGDREASVSAKALPCAASRAVGLEASSGWASHSGSPAGVRNGVGAGVGSSLAPQPPDGSVAGEEGRRPTARGFILESGEARPRAPGAPGSAARKGEAHHAK